MTTLILDAINLGGGSGLTGLLISFLILVVVLAIIGGLIWCIQNWISPLPPPVLLVIAIILVILVIIWGHPELCEMSERYIDVVEGDRVIITVVPKPEVPPTGGEDLHVLIEIPPVTILTNNEGTYVHYVSDCDVCTDGSGDDHGDDYHQNQTAYYNKGEFLNADVDKYVVVPPQVRSMVVPTVMGCQARVTNMETGVVSDGVVGDIGPKSKTGECAICLAQILNPEVSANVGDSNRIYLYEIYPGKPAVVDGKTYRLEPA